MQCTSTSAIGGISGGCALILNEDSGDGSSDGVNDAANPSLTYTTKEELIRDAVELCTQIVLEQDTMIEIEAPVN
ncbi:hypothetical protein Y032_0140g2151, partial [Ancylostoma ceylanicum]